MIQTKIAIVGKGAVGMATAIAITKLKPQLSIALIGSDNFTEQDDRQQRIVAINQASKNYLEAIDIWQYLNPQFVIPYNKVAVWENDTAVKLNFNANETTFDQLGYIVSLIDLELTLIKQLSKYPNIQLINSNLEKQQTINNTHLLTFDDQQQLLCNFLIGADGLHSTVRKLLNLGEKQHDYDQLALTAVVELGVEHNNTAYQSFSATQILGVLPLSNPRHAGIVWSVHTPEAQRLLQLDQQQLEQQLFLASNNNLGVIKLLTPIKSFPLVKIDALEIAGDDFILIGDAAHRIHPLAGLGLNLGLADSWRLADLIASDFKFDSININKLQALARERKAKSFEISNSMSLIKYTFNNDNPLLKLARGLVSSAVNNIGPIKDHLIQITQGFKEIQFSLASFDKTTDLELQNNINNQADDNSKHN